MESLGWAAVVPFPPCAWVTSVHLCGLVWPRAVELQLLVVSRDVRCRESPVCLPSQRSWRSGEADRHRADTEQLSPAT